MLTVSPLPLTAKTLHVPRDFETIQAAVDAASSGDSVLVEQGTYNERVRLQPGVALKSDGSDAEGKRGLKRAEATIINGGGEAGAGPGVTMAAGATLDGFTVTDVGVYDDAEWKKHHATQGNDQTHEHIGAPGTPGIEVAGVNCTVRNNIVHHIGYSGIGILGVEGKDCSPLIINNVCFRNMGGGIGSMKKSTAIIRGNKCFENFYAGIGHDDASPLVVDNECWGNVRAGIGVSEGSKPIVRHNKCYKNRRAGIGVRTGSETQPLIEDNDCYENDMAGIGASEHSAPTIRNNRCYRNELVGIGSETHATPVIVGNECYENELVGIGQRSDANTVLIGNYCHHNKKAGIGFDECKAGKATVANNRVIDNKLVAVGIHSGWKVLLSGNELSRKGGLPPIVMVFEGAEATLTGNAIRGEGVAGVRVAGSVRVVKNRFEGLAIRKAGPPNFAVWALPGSTVSMSDNEISTWRHALHASKSEISAIRNTVRSFHRSAFVITEPAKPAHIVGNVAISDDKQAKIVTIDGAKNVVEDNVLRAHDVTQQPRR
jgi:parallel beta-helix repeat protein